MMDPEPNLFALGSAWKYIWHLMPQHYIAFNLGASQYPIHLQARFGQWKEIKGPQGTWGKHA